MADFEKVYSIKIDTRQAQAALKRLDKGIDGIEKSAKDAEKRLGKFLSKELPAAARKSKKSLKDLEKQTKQLGKTFKKVGNNLSLYVTAPLLAAGGASLKFALDFNKAMANVESLLTGGRFQIQGLKEDVQELAIETGKSTDDLAEGLYNVVSALGESTENTDQLRIATRAAIAGVADTSESIDLLSAVTKGYGDTSADALQKASDLSLLTVKLGKTTYPELAGAMGRVIPLAATLNTSQEELFGTMATLTGVTGNTAEVSTQLASIYSAFLKPSEKMTAAAKKNGFATASQMMKTLGFRESLIALNKEANGNEAILAKMFGRKEALVGALALLGGQSDEYTRKLKEMNNWVGATDEAYRRQTEGINEQGHSWERTQQRMVVFSQRIGDQLIPVLEQLMDALEPILTAIEAWDEDDVNLALSIAGVAAAIGPLIKGISALNVALTFLAANPVVATIVGIGIAVGLVIANFDTLRNSVEWLITSLEELWIWFHKVTTGKAVSFLGKVFDFDTSGMAGSEENLQKQLEETQRRKSRIFADTESEAANRRNVGAAKKTARNIRDYGLTNEQISDPFAMQTLATAGAGGGSFSMGDTNVVVNAPGGNGDQIARSLVRELDKRDRRVRAGLKREAHSLAPGEQ